MAASYPSSTKSFTTKTDGPAQTVFAAHVNDIQDEVVAVENGLRTGLAHNTIPDADATRDLGSSSKQWANVFTPHVVFPATQSASSGANTLDDYEELTWTPVIGGSGGTSGQTYTTQIGHYIKIGKQVTAWFNIVLSAKGTITTSVQIQGLPFTIEAGTSPGLMITHWSALATSWAFLGGFGTAATTTATVSGFSSAAVGATGVSSITLTTTDISNTTQLVGVITYRASS